MARFHTLAAMALLLCFPLMLDAQYQIIQLADIQLAKTLSATVQDTAGSPMPKVLVQEFTPDWKTVLRTSTTGADGKFSLAPVKGRKIYCLQMLALGFDPLRVRVQVDPKRGTDLKLRLEIAT